MTWWYGVKQPMRSTPMSGDPITQHRRTGHRPRHLVIYNHRHTGHHPRHLGIYTHNQPYAMVSLEK
jgi:hypothetical protein